ncbi:EpsG family protein [Flavobacterium sp. GT3R68]|nr:EpsG family protein [Flavobacterium sp. GSN2]TRW92531.1 EpsG family protein [Flavobacterium sp. GT3R68]
MFDWIPSENYTLIYYNMLFMVVLLTVLHTQLLGIDERKNKSYLQFTGKIILLFVILYMGLRPVSGFYFGDMGTYNMYFESYQEGNPIIAKDDVAFHLFMKACSYVMTAGTFFLLCAAIYVLPLWYLSKKWFADYWFYAFLLLVGSFSFWAYGTNGIRNGMATSLFIIALVFTERKAVMIFFLLLACAVHKSILLPTVAYGLTLVQNNPKKYFYVWLAAIPLSLALGGFWENFFAGLGFGDDRMSYLTEGNINEDDFSSTGFRWDFLIYSATGVFAGYYFVIKKGFKDKLYHHLLNIYLIVNAFWILVIRANFSNRFAYLSWFMLALVIIYPFLKQRFFLKQHQVIGYVLIAYFTFTYLMNVILA